LVAAQEIKWVKHFFNKNVLHFVRPNGWHSVTNFGTKPVALPKGQVLLSSLPLVDGKLPADATAWIKR
jgi:alpha-glucosidase